MENENFFVFKCPWVILKLEIKIYLILAPADEVSEDVDESRDVPALSTDSFDLPTLVDRRKTSTSLLDSGSTRVTDSNINSVDFRKPSPSRRSDVSRSTSAAGVSLLQPMSRLLGSQSRVATLPTTDQLQLLHSQVKDSFQP